MESTRKIFYHKFDSIHNFSLAYIQTRITFQTVYAKAVPGSLTELDRLFVGALYEAYLAPISFTIRDKYIAKWKYTKEEHVLIRPIDINIKRDWCGIYAKVKTRTDKEKDILLKAIADSNIGLGAYMSEEWLVNAVAPKPHQLLEVLQNINVDALRLEEIVIPVRHPTDPRYRQDVLMADREAEQLMSLFDPTSAETERLMQEVEKLMAELDVEQKVVNGEGEDECSRV
jgi:hypothetical protein